MNEFLAVAGLVLVLILVLMSFSVTKHGRCKTCSATLEYSNKQGRCPRCKKVVIRV